MTMKTQEQWLEELLDEVRQTRRYAEGVKESSLRLQALIQRVLDRESPVGSGDESILEEMSIEAHRLGDEQAADKIDNALANLHHGDSEQEH